MTTRVRPQPIRQESDARAAAIGSIAELDGIRFTKVDEDRWSAEGDRSRRNEEMLRARLWVVRH